MGWGDNREICGNEPRTTEPPKTALVIHGRDSSWQDRVGREGGGREGGGREGSG